MAPRARILAAFLVHRLKAEKNGSVELTVAEICKELNFTKRATQIALRQVRDDGRHVIIQRRDGFRSLYSIPAAPARQLNLEARMPQPALDPGSPIPFAEASINLSLTSSKGRTDG